MLMNEPSFSQWKSQVFLGAAFPKRIRNYLRLSGDRLGDKERRCGCKSSNYNSLQCRALGFSASKTAFDIAEDTQSRQRHNDRPHQRLMGAVQNHVRRKWNKTSGYVGTGDGESALQGSLRIGFFEAKLETHHEVHPFFGLFGERL